MKQYLFNTTIKSSLSVLVILFALASCTKMASDTEKPKSAKEFLDAKPGSVREVRLRISVRDAAGDKITSDGGGDYVDGTQYVSAYLSQVGYLQFSTLPGSNPNSPPPTRWLNFNNNSPSSVIIPPPVTAILKGTGAVTGKSSLQGTYIPIQSLAINQSECVPLTTGMGGIYAVNFHRGPYDVANSSTAYVVVTRTSSTTWTMTPVGSCSPVSNVAALIEASTGKLYGYYNFPFSFTLTAL